MLVLCWHNTSAYYALYYAGIFDAGSTIGQDVLAFYILEEMASLVHLTVL